MQHWKESFSKGNVEKCTLNQCTINVICHDKN